jgi:hypothetical protein
MGKSKQKSRKRQLTNDRSIGEVFPQHTPSSARLISVVEKAPTQKLRRTNFDNSAVHPAPELSSSTGVTSLQESEYGGVGINTVGTFFFCARSHLLTVFRDILSDIDYLHEYYTE